MADKIKQIAERLSNREFELRGSGVSVEHVQDEFERILREELAELLGAIDKTIEFYDAHGGPMGELRKQREEWR